MHRLCGHWDLALISTFVRFVVGVVYLALECYVNGGFFQHLLCICCPRIYLEAEYWNWVIGVILANWWFPGVIFLAIENAFLDFDVFNPWISMLHIDSFWFSWNVTVRRFIPSTLCPCQVSLGSDCTFYVVIGIWIWFPYLLDLSWALFLLPGSAVWMVVFSSTSVIYLLAFFHFFWNGV